MRGVLNIILLLFRPFIMVQTRCLTIPPHVVRYEPCSTFFGGIGGVLDTDTTFSSANIFG